jgi:hypothetical protein
MTDENLRIAWRYGSQIPGANQTDTPSTITNPSSHSAKTFQANYFVTNNFMSYEDDIKPHCDTASFKFDNIGTKSASSFYADLQNDLSAHIDKLNMNVNKTKQYKNILRIGLFDSNIVSKKK